jgi:hypothetical protein
MSSFNNNNNENNNMFTHDDVYQIYCSNEHLDIMNLAILTKKFPHIIYKILKPHFERPKDLRGYREYKNYYKKHNELSNNIHDTHDELQDINCKLEELLLKKEELTELKKNQKKEYLDFMNKVIGQDEDADSSVSEYEMEDD